MKTRHTRRSNPELERLDGRLMLTAGLSASLSHGVLSVVGNSPSAPIVVDVLAQRGRHGVSGVVTVEGVGNFKASRVRQVIVTSVTGEGVEINKAARWNPVFKFNVIGSQGTNSPSQPPSNPSPPVNSSPSNPTSPVNPTPNPPPGQSASSLSSTMSSDEQAIVDAVNQIRTQNGLAPLQVNGQLVQMAHLQANNMATYNTMSHTIAGAPQPGLADRASFIGYNYSWLGENIAFNYSDVNSVMNAWMNSPDHRANILNANYTQIGVGITYSSSGQPYFCQDFGQPAS